ncbi:MAG: GntR family transcriptional regulator [Candidatus Competibacteraceae bacterium]|nr:GntR family transcriptional regulator [Candidatus Competibacteraceae bacterium]MCB1807368.1 GntR family transcriptional regulator [Candidatus Competibacteraceae bacterium]MCB1812453.1 GntR family transcriptional regulator [Candidatus Competibacteraceae bacterium]
MSTDRSRQPERSSGSDNAIYQAVFDAVMTHRLPPGTKLTEATLGKLFGVSRTVVRQALQRLAHENIIELRLNRSAVIASPSVQETRDVFAARRVIESAVIRSLTAGLPAPQLAELRQLTETEKQAFTQGDQRRCLQLSGAFHLRLAALAPNQVLARFLSELVSRSSLMLALYETPGTSTCAMDDHGAIIDLIENGNIEAAVAAMEQHLKQCENQLQLENKNKPIDLADIFSLPTST